ncbi:MAG: hypothetical protein J6T03_07530 [Bacteroidales bacterium]|nr:hypothetical protein [Bacteroidales bacterium]
MITKDNYEAMLLQYHENLLDGRLREEVDAFLRQNPDIEQEYRQYYSCEPIVTPHHVHYRYKDSLKRKVVQPTAWRWWAAAACIAVLFATAVWLWSRTGTETGTGAEPTGYIASAEPATTAMPASTATTSTQLEYTTKDGAQAGLPKNAVAAEKKRLPMEMAREANQESLPDETQLKEQHMTAQTTQTPVCESDKLVVYGIRVENRNNLVACPKADQPCNNLACRLALTGQRLGML